MSFALVADRTPPQTPPAGPAAASLAEDLAALHLDDDGPAFKTPTSSPVKKTPISTPSPVRVFKETAMTITPERSHVAREKAGLEDCLDALDRLTDTPERQAKATHTKRVMDTILETALPRIGATSVARKPVDPDEVDEKAFTASPRRRSLGLKPPVMENDFEGCWPESSLEQLMKSYLDCEHRPSEENPFFVVNLGHALLPTLAGKGAVGFHLLCPENAHCEAAYKLQKTAENPITGVWAGTYQLPGSKGPKLSTFFPKEIESSEALLALLDQGEVVCRKDNRIFMKIPGQKFLVEAYLRREYVVWSCFPVFYYAPFDPMTTYQVTDTIRLTPDNVLAYGRLAAKDKKEMYQTKDTCIVDIAKQIPGCPLASGIYIEFPKAVL